jgi:homoserine O-succinyltransferase/O-acetyltransferase
MPLLLDTTRSNQLPSENCLTIGLINNMPDAALKATERQFIDVIATATRSAVVRLKLFSLSDVPRAPHVRRELGQRCLDVSELWDTHLDGLIVTGTEPRAANLKDEPYWTTLTELVDWARENTISTIWSCLAAHAVVLYTDSIERYPLPYKRFGVYDCQVIARNLITRDVSSPLRIPHSRYNDLSERALASCGYQILTRSAVAGVDTFYKQERSFFLFFQGHPEYEADTLLREYRRDIKRFLRGEQECYPAMPQGVFNNEGRTIANEFRNHALGDRRDDLIDRFPMSSLEGGLENTWRANSIALFRSWIGYLCTQRKRANVYCTAGHLAQQAKEIRRGNRSRHMAGRS